MDLPSSNSLLANTRLCSGRKICLLRLVDSFHAKLLPHLQFGSRVLLYARAIVAWVVPVFLEFLMALRRCYSLLETIDLCSALEIAPCSQSVILQMDEL